jgi:hypothetical protein
MLLVPCIWDELYLILDLNVMSLVMYYRWSIILGEACSVISLGL